MDNRNQARDAKARMMEVAKEFAGSVDPIDLAEFYKDLARDVGATLHGMGGAAKKKESLLVMDEDGVTHGSFLRVGNECGDIFLVTRKGYEAYVVVFREVQTEGLPAHLQVSKAQVCLLGCVAEFTPLTPTRKQAAEARG